MFQRTEQAHTPCSEHDNQTQANSAFHVQRCKRTATTQCKPSSCIARNSSSRSESSVQYKSVQFIAQPLPSPCEVLLSSPSHPEAGQSGHSLSLVSLFLVPLSRSTRCHTAFLRHRHAQARPQTQPCRLTSRVLACIDRMPLSTEPSQNSTQSRTRRGDTSMQTTLPRIEKRTKCQPMPKSLRCPAVSESLSRRFHHARKAQPCTVNHARSTTQASSCAVSCRGHAHVCRMQVLQSALQ